MSDETHIEGDEQQTRRGAPDGNRNRLRHGLRTSRTPPGCRDIEIDARKLRRNLEDAVLANCGEVAIYQAALINSAVRHEKRARLIERWLSQNAELPLTDRCQLLRELSAATDSRDKCLEKLKQGKDWSMILYGKPSDAK